jgi:hypothetical protein
MMTRKLNGKGGRILLSAALAFLLGMSGLNRFPTVRAESHADHADRARLTLNEGKKWETDAPLRAGMERIRTLAEGFSWGFNADERRAFANVIQGQITFLIENCELAPEADASLHVLIADIQDGAGAIAKDNSGDRGMSSIRKALELYPRYFDHPGWRISDAAATHER